MNENRLTVPTIPVQYVVEMLAASQFKGYPVEDFLRPVGLSPEIFRQPATLISTRQYDKLMRTIRDHLADEFLGFLHYPVPSNAFSVGVKGSVGFPNLYEALNFLADFYNLLSQDFHWNISREATQSQILLAFDLTTAFNPKFIIDALLRIPHRLGNWLSGAYLPVRQATFTFSEPLFPDHHRYLFGQDILYEQPENTLTFDLDFAKQPIIRTQGDVPHFLRTSAHYLMLNPETNPFTQKVRQILFQALPHGFPKFIAIARELQMSHQTLWRKLSEESTNYRLIKQNLRRDVAITYLAKPESRIDEISEQLGYSEPRNFYRAFKTWTGMTPGQYKEMVVWGTPTNST